MTPAHCNLVINYKVFFNRKLEREKADILKTKNQMALDLERLLNQREVSRLMLASSVCALVMSAVLLEYKSCLVD